MKNKKLEWTMKDGTPILITDMGDNHLVNTIKFMKSRMDSAPGYSKVFNPYLEAMQEEIKKRFYETLLKEKI